MVERNYYCGDCGSRDIGLRTLHDYTIDEEALSDTFRATLVGDPMCLECGSWNVVEKFIRVTAIIGPKEVTDGHA